MMENWSFFVWRAIESFFFDKAHPALRTIVPEKIASLTHLHKTPVDVALDFSPFSLKVRKESAYVGGICETVCL